MKVYMTYLYGALLCVFYEFFTGNAQQLPLNDSLNETHLGVLNGKQVRDLYEARFMVAVYYEDDKDQIHLCAGSLLESRTVLTAAHCVIGSRPGWIHYGTYDRYKVVYDNIEVEEPVKHPSYDIIRSAKYDIAILRLKYPVSKDRGGVSFIKPFKIKAVSEACPVNAYGWGATNDYVVNVTEPITSQMLMKTRMKVLNKHKCDPDTICAQKANTAMCVGDSGSPMVYRHHLVGIQSRIWANVKSHPCQANNIALYADTSFHYQWIESTLKSKWNIDLNNVNNDVNNVS